ncbi:unnamed protein product [Adineta steineri]|uniref:G-protein coupled receptors family 1 profile domain-containing protein n=1 Tax=Adineta steineri TaxID=433720 RepID=A0A815NIK9_9BILA|nr:unnamed protein product [Adineta steineri]CAF4102048.1 unnamed protein product [Adineta steineri]
MSTSTVLYTIQTNLFRFGGPALILIGSISCIFNLMVFTKSTLRKNPCTICFIAVNSQNLIYYYVAVLVTTLSVGYDIDPSSISIHFCRFRFYVGYVFASWEATCLILASIDRTLVTSSKANTQKLSSRRLILISLISLGLFWMIFHIHALIFMEIEQFGPNYFVCYYRSGAYTIFITYYLLLINGLLPPLTMAILGFVTVNNIRRVGRAALRIEAINGTTVTIGRNHTLQSKDHQLIRMLLMDIIIYVISKTPLAIFYIYQQITQYQEKSLEQQAIEESILYFTYFLFFIENSISAYTNILVSSTYRTEIKRILSNSR